MKRTTLGPIRSSPETQGPVELTVGPEESVFFRPPFLARELEPANDDGWRLEWGGWKDSRASPEDANSGVLTQGIVIAVTSAVEFTREYRERQVVNQVVPLKGVLESLRLYLTIM